MKIMMFAFYFIFLMKDDFFISILKNRHTKKYAL